VKSREAVARLAPVGLLVLSVVVAGCAESIEGLHPPAPGERVKPIYVINHGWHTGIAVRRADIPKGVWPEHRDLPASEYVEVGWGDRDFYVAPEGTLWVAVRAAVWSRSSVLHLVWFDGPVAQFFRQGEIVEVFVSDRGFHQLAVLIEDAYVKDGSGRAIVLGVHVVPAAEEKSVTVAESGVVCNSDVVCIVPHMDPGTCISISDIVLDPTGRGLIDTVVPTISTGGRSDMVDNVAERLHVIVSIPAVEEDTCTAAAVCGTGVVDMMDMRITDNSSCAGNIDTDGPWGS
jgi:hypothetical protein